MSTSDTTNALQTANDQLALYFPVGRPKAVESSLEFPRADTYGAAVVNSLYGGRMVLPGLEGSKWVGTNVPGTPIVDAAALTAFVATTPTFVLFNNNTVASGINLIPTRFKVQVAAAGTNGTNWLGQWLVDTGNRVTAGGTALTLVNPNLNVANAKTGAKATFGAITAPAANASRIVHSSGYRTVLKVIGDIITFEFGATAPTAPGMPTEGTLQCTQVIQLPEIVLPPQCSLLWYEYAASQSVAASFDYIQLEYLER